MSQKLFSGLFSPAGLGLTLLAGLLLVLGGCGDRKIQTGRFLDSGAVSGLAYSTPSVSGVTNESGEFQYRTGEIVSFQLHELTLGEAEGSEVLTTLDIVEGATDVTNDRVTNIARLLQSLDENDNPDDGVQLPSTITSASNVNINLSAPQGEFEATAYLQAVKGEDATLISSFEAQENLRQSIDDNVNTGELSFSAGSDRSVSQGATVTLTGEINGNVTDFSWEPDPDNEINITLTDSALNGSLTPLQRQFEAPEVSVATDLVFIFTVISSDGTTETDEVTITVTL